MQITNFSTEELLFCLKKLTLIEVRFSPISTFVNKLPVFAVKNFRRFFKDLLSPGSMFGGKFL